MRIKRATVVSIIILTLAMGLVAPMAGVPGPSSLYPVVISLSTGENVSIATHTNDLEDGNWIELSGGTEIRIPSLTIAYEGLDSATYEGDVADVTIESNFAAGEATYPLTTHRVYSIGQPIIAKLWGADYGWMHVFFKLIRVSSITEARDVLTSAFQGDLTPLKDKLDKPTWELPTVIVIGGDSDTVTIDPEEPGVNVEAGVYILAVGHLNDDDIWIDSATIIAVVDQTLQISVP